MRLIEGTGDREHEGGPGDGRGIHAAIHSLIVSAVVRCSARISCISTCVLHFIPPTSPLIPAHRYQHLQEHFDSTQPRVDSIPTKRLCRRRAHSVRVGRSEYMQLCDRISSAKRLVSAQFRRAAQRNLDVGIRCRSRQPESQSHPFKQ